MSTVDSTLKRLSVIAATGLLVVAACQPPETGRNSEALADMGQDGIRTVTITPLGNQMRFAQTEIRAEAGEQLRVIMDNTATSPAMYHNVLFVSDAALVDEVGRAAMGAAARDYIPDHPAVIASTPMAAPGQRVEVVFAVPEEPGEYPFVCTYPGHYAMMRGTLVAE